MLEKLLKIGGAEVLMKHTVTDKIGDEYREWQRGDTVFISAPTGTGKTYFVFNTLLSYAKETGRKILYLVNRTMLKEQLEKEISKRPFNEQIIRVELYQTIENCLCSLCRDNYGFYQPKDGNQPMLQELAGEYSYVVCDECHYFLTDSNYNTNTWLSYQWVQECLGEKIRIFLSATISDIKKHILEDNEKYRYSKTNIYGFHANNTMADRVLNNNRNFYEYDLDPDYSYIKIEVINKRDKIIDLVCEGKKKWLIFVDSISVGKEIQKAIKSRLRQEIAALDDPDVADDNEVVFLSSGYKREDRDASAEVLSIKNTDAQSARILITTSVMDNGVNLKDRQLKNLVIFADNETEFIQMLGRRREDGNQINLYILRRERDYFRRRRDGIIWLEKIAEEYWENINKAINEPIKTAVDLKENIYLEGMNQAERELVKSKSKELLYRLFNEENMYDKLKVAFYAYNGWLCLNQLSLCQMDKLKIYYDQMVTKFDEEGEDAFVREQLRWLGKQEGEIEGIICENKKTAEEKSRDQVCCLFDGIADKPLAEDVAIEFKKKVKDDLLVLLQSCEECKDKQTVVNSIKKPDRAISSKNMKYLRENCKLPYVMDVKSNAEDGETIYTLKRLGM